MSTKAVAPRSSGFLLQVIKQTSPFEERVTRNGIPRDVHVVIKNSPFVVQLATIRNCDVDLNHVAFEAALLYDTDGEKGVDFVKVKPIEFKSLPNETGDQCSVELRIKVLTSQHEDMFFKVRIQGQDPITKADIPNLKAITGAIKVISKPEQLKKRQPPPKKRNVNDMVVEAVTRIEKQQSEQALLLKMFLEQSRFKQMDSRTSWLEPITSASTSSPKAHDFESSFGNMMKCFEATDPNQRAEKIRRVVRSCSSSENETVSEFIDLLMTEGMGVEIGREQQPLSLNTSLPHVVNTIEKMENVFFNPALNHFGNVVENSYSEFLSNSQHNTDFLL